MIKLWQQSKSINMLLCGVIRCPLSLPLGTLSRYNFYCTKAEGSPRSKRRIGTKKRKHSQTAFIDTLRIHVKGGTGGCGFPTKGGIGGKGGDVKIVGNSNMDLSKLKKMCPAQRFKGESGEDSRFFCLFGKAGKSLEIPVPLGITAVSEQTNVKIGEINKPKDTLVIAQGGMGGCLENGFSAQQGQTHTVKLDLKLIADVGLVGFPNAGKSTLLKAISAAKPKIASYPFTTIRPNIGVTFFRDGRHISIADLPGLIEGAHKNLGMGHKFLKHVERTHIITYVIDLHGFQLGPKYPVRSALETIILLVKELELYQADLLEKKSILVLNKCDVPDSYDKVMQVRDTLETDHLYEKFIETLPPSFVPESRVSFEKIVPISAAKDRNSVDVLKDIIRKELDILDEEKRLKLESL